MATGIFEEVRKAGRSVLLEPEAKSICKEFGMPVTKFGVGKNIAEALDLARAIGYPVAVKAVSSQIVHKTDAGAVILNVRSPEELKTAWEMISASIAQRVPGAEVLGILIEEMVPGGVEVVVGGMNDKQFGPVVMFGLGGIMVEVLKDVSFRAVPITPEDARQMIGEIRGYPMLKGARGSAPVKIQALVDVLLGASRLLERNRQVTELDLNPVIASAVGATVVDARMVIEGPVGSGKHS